MKSKPIKKFCFCLFSARSCLTQFSKNCRKPVWPLFTRWWAGRLRPELRVGTMGRHLNSKAIPLLPLSPLEPSKFSTMTVGSLVLHLFSQTTGILKKPTLGQGSYLAFIWGLIPLSTSGVGKCNWEGVVTTRHMVSLSITMHSYASVLGTQMPLWTVLPSPSLR